MFFDDFSIRRTRPRSHNLNFEVKNGAIILGNALVCTNAKPKLVIPRGVAKASAQENVGTRILEQVVIVLAHILISVLFATRSLVPNSVVVEHVIVVVTRLHVNATHDIVAPPLARDSLYRVISVRVERCPKPKDFDEHPLIDRIPAERLEVLALEGERAKLLGLEAVRHFC